MLRRIINFLENQDRPEQPQVAPARSETPDPVTMKVLIIVQDPEMNNDQTLFQTMRWNDPQQLAVQYARDLNTVSQGYINYEVVESIHDQDFPRKADGFSYTPEEFKRCWESRSGFHQPDLLDYSHLIDRFNLVERVNSGQCDEVWLFGFPYAGYYESHMVGPGAFFCNSGPTVDERFNKRFVIMGFNVERGGGEMLENYGHRTESIMAHVYRNHSEEYNLWERFIRYDKTFPGRAECGNVHFAPNSERDYDWGNATPVECYADNWLNFPEINGPPRRMTCADWGHGEIRAHHLWWFQRLPHVTGETDGVSHNWWMYVNDPNMVPN
ncbi:MAG: hypothetical protein AAF633_05620 [Chloroflexota bacterium]